MSGLSCFRIFGIETNYFVVNFFCYTHRPFERTNKAFGDSEGKKESDSLIPKYSVKKPYTVLVMVVAILVLGYVSFTRMTPELFPNINLPYVAVMTPWPGAAPEEVEKNVTIPLEEQLATLDDLKNIQSESMESYSLILLEFESDANLDIVSVDIRDKVDLADNGFEDTVGDPIIYKMNPNMIPTTVAAVNREGMTSEELSTFVENDLMRRLDAINGVASVTTAGLVESTVHISLDADKITKLNKDLKKAIKAKTDEAKSGIESGISAAEEGLSQVDSGKEQIRKAQQELSAQREMVGPALEQIAQLVAARDAAQQVVDALKDLPEMQNPQQPGVDPEAVQKAMEDAAKQLDIDPAQAQKAAEDAAKQLNIDQEDAQDAADDTAEALDPQQAVDAAQKALDDAIAQLKPYKEQLKMVGVDIDTMTKDAASAQAAVTAFNIAMNTTADELSNSMSDLSATDAYLRSSIMQLQTTLGTIEAQADSAPAVDLTSVLSAANISQILAAENFDMPAGYISENEKDAIVSVGEGFSDLKEIEDLILFDPGVEGFDPVRIKDVATVKYVNNSDEVYARINGEDGVLLSFSKQSDTPTAEVSDNILEAFDDLSGEYDGLSFHVLSDQGEYIDIVIQGVLRNLLIGAILAILILLLFLRDIKPTLITAISIPVSLTFALVLMYFSGVTLNIISLAGLAVGVGMLVDNSIVVIENIYRLRHMGISKIQAAVSGASQVAGAITASTLTTICVFFPIVFVDGFTRDIFTDMALTIGYSLFASLFIALTVVPAMGSTMLEKTSEKAWFSDRNRGLLKTYMFVLDKALAHRMITLLLAVVLLAASAFVVLGRGIEYMPAMATQQISASVTMPEDISDKEAMQIADEIEEETMALDGVETVGIMPANSTASIMGVTGDADFSEMTMYVLLAPDQISKNAEVSSAITTIGKDKGCEMFVSGDMDMTQMMGGSTVSVNVFGDNNSDLRTAVVMIEDALRGMPELQEVSDVNENSQDEVVISVNKNKAMKKGMTVAQVYQAVAQALSDTSRATTIRYKGGDRDIIIETGEKNDRLTRDDLETLKLTYTDPLKGSTVKFELTDVAEIRDGKTLAFIGHLNQARGIRVTASAATDESTTILQEKVEKTIGALDLPDGIRLEYQGQNEQIEDAMKDLIKMMLLGILLIYLIMVAQFQSLRSPFIVMFTMPLAFTGGFLALLITGNVFSIVGMIGFIVLLGIVVNNGIVLVDYINQMRHEGLEKTEAIREAGAARIRPVLMTAMTTVLGLIPLAFGIGDGAEMVQPVAIVCIGGLLYATLMTLVVIPVVYDLFNRKNLRTIREEELTVLDI